MRINKILFILAFVVFLPFYSFSKDVDFEASDIKIIDNDKIIAFESKTKIHSKNITVESDKVEYEKKSNILLFSGEVLLTDKKNNISIKSDKIVYNRNLDLISTSGKTNINFNNNYKIDSEELFYDKRNQRIYSNNRVNMEDNEDNLYTFKDKFFFDLETELIKSKKSFILDNKDNKYIFENLLIDLKNSEIIGKEIKIEFENSYFGNKNNDPILKGRSIYSNDESLKVYKAAFSTCNTENKKCRGWELNTNEFNHDKTKKIFEYRDSWLKLFDYKVFYFPYFNHPDPTVKRRSGFLTPSYSSSDSLGTSINFPYYKVLSSDKDITFSPRYYADKSFLLQNEYRQALENSKIISDFSFLVGNEGTNSHFFYNQLGKINNNLNFEINLQDVKGDNYLKTHDLSKTSSLISNDNVLMSNFDAFWNFSDAKLNTSFKVFEDLSRNYHDRYQFIFPDFNFIKNLEIPKSYNGSFSFNSYGYNKNYDTNIVESVITNDFIFNSNDYVSEKGFVTNYDLLLKNSNSYANNSNNFEENGAYNLYGKLKIDTSFPLINVTKSATNYLKPIASIRYSPNGNSDLSTKDILLNYDSVFNLNRVGTTYEVEGGESLSLGLEYKRQNNKREDIFDFKVANVLRLDENIYLPKKTKLNNKRSDIFGELNFNFNNNFNMGYIFSYDKDIKYSNLDGLNMDLSLNNFFTNIYYYAEDNDLDNKETVRSKSDYIINKENKISFDISKDLRDDFTQYYDLIYEYKNDCLSLSFNYNKSFYSDGNLEPNTSLSFLIKIIPFTELGVSDIGNVINN